MKNYLIVLFLMVATSLWGQTTQTRNVGPFTGIKVGEGIDVYLKKGDKESVRVEVTGTDVTNVLTELSGSYLKIHMKDGNYRKVEAKVYVTFVKLDKLSASSAGSIVSESVIKGDNLEIDVSSAGSVEVQVEVKSLTVDASSAAEVELKGKTLELEAEASSAAQIDAYDLESAQVEANASSGASMKINVLQELQAHASSGGSIRYRGNPGKSITDASSGGSVRKSE